MLSCKSLWSSGHSYNVHPRLSVSPLDFSRGDHTLLQSPSLCKTPNPLTGDPYLSAGKNHTGYWGVFCYWKTRRDRKLEHMACRSIMGQKPPVDLTAISGAYNSMLLLCWNCRPPPLILDCEERWWYRACSPTFLALLGRIVLPPHSSWPLKECHLNCIPSCCTSKHIVSPFRLRLHLCGNLQTIPKAASPFISIIFVLKGWDGEWLSVQVEWIQMGAELPGGCTMFFCLSQTAVKCQMLMHCFEYIPRNEPLADWQMIDFCECDTHWNLQLKNP